MESELSRDELIKLVVEKEQLLLTKQEELENMKDKVLRSFAEMENVKERTRRESENSKKFAIQVLICSKRKKKNRFYENYTVLLNLSCQISCVMYDAEFCEKPFGCGG